MKKKNILILLITLILLIIAAFLVIRQSSGTFRKRDEGFCRCGYGKYHQSFFADKNNNTILLERKAAGDWLLNETLPSQKFRDQHAF